MSKQIRVGIFVLVGLGLLTAAVFLIGDNRKMWESRVVYSTAFHDVAGLRPGAPVRMGGIDIGNVGTVGHAPDAADDRIYVTMSIIKKEAPRVRRGTIAHVLNKGLLGDKMVELTVVPDGAPQDPADLIAADDPRDMFANADALAGRARSVVEKLEPLAKTLGDKGFGEDIRASAESMRASADAVRTLLQGLVKTDSIAHKMLLDPEEGQRFHALLANLTELSAHARGVVADAHEITAHVKSGKGLVGSLIYDADVQANMAKTIDGARRIAEGLGTATQAMNQPDNRGLVHTAIYGDPASSGWISNLTQMTGDLRDIVRGLREGKGTIGALLVDPTVYEDLKAAIGNVERNQVLRAIVRYSIKADEARPHVDTPKVEPRQQGAR